MTLRATTRRRREIVHLFVEEHRSVSHVVRRVRIECSPCTWGQVWELVERVLREEMRKR